MKRSASSSSRGAPRSPRSRPASPTTGNRRVPGLRRTEVAALAQVSVEYYSKVERGALGGVSAPILDAIARALQLDDAERAHLFHLAHAADGTSAGMRPRRRPTRKWTPRPALQWVLDGIAPPAIIRNGRMDLLATNHLGRAMHASLYEQPAGQPAELRPVHLPRPRRLTRFLPRLGHSPPTPAWRSCAPKPAATRTTRTSTTSSVSCPPAAPTSAASGERTTSATTAPARSTSTTTSSATSSSPTRAWTWCPTPASPSPSTPRSRPPPPPTPWTCWPHGPLPPWTATSTSTS